MATERAPAGRPLRVVAPRPAETSALDLGDATRVYALLLSQSRQLQAALDALRSRILRAMGQAGVDTLEANGYQVVRQVRRFPPRLDEGRAEAILRAAGRLDEAQRVVLDAARASQIVDELCIRGKIRREDLPYVEPREVEALVVRRMAEAAEPSAEPGDSESNARRAGV